MFIQVEQNKGKKLKLNVEHFIRSREHQLVCWFNIQGIPTLNVNREQSERSVIPVSGKNLSVSKIITGFDKNEEIDTLTHYLYEYDLPPLPEPT